MKPSAPREIRGEFNSIYHSKDSYHRTSHYPTLSAEVASCRGRDLVSWDWIGEFGRTPTITKAEGGGRDHWPDCFSIVLAGGGVRGGTVYGSSDKRGAYPDSDPVSSGDLAATLFWRFGLDPTTLIHDRLGRPIRIGEGEPVRSLFC